MGHRVLALSLVSASNLKDVNLFSRMEVYAVAPVCGHARTRQRTATDREGGRHPKWEGTPLLFTVPPTADAASDEGACLHVLLRTERFFSSGDCDIGEVFIPLADLLAGASAGATPWECASYQVRKVQSTERRGMLSVSYRLGPLLPDTNCWDDAYELPPGLWLCYPPPGLQIGVPGDGAALSSAESYAAGAKA